MTTTRVLKTRYNTDTIPKTVRLWYVKETPLKEHPWKPHNKGQLTMCICDDKYFKVVNMTTGHVKLYKRAASIAKRFDCSRDWVFHCLNHSNLYTYRGGVNFNIEVNKHPECMEVRKDIIQKYGVRLGKIPDRFRYLLPENRQ